MEAEADVEANAGMDEEADIDVNVDDDASGRICSPALVCKLRPVEWSELSSGGIFSLSAIIAEELA